MQSNFNNKLSIVKVNLILNQRIITKVGAVNLILLQKKLKILNDVNTFFKYGPNVLL